MMKKHAYLIKAHHQFALLRKLLMLLDDERNDIYIHIGMDVKFEREELKGVVKKSALHFVESVREQWGGYSQIQSELILFQAAWEHGYAYYHLISGVDLPIKTRMRYMNFSMSTTEKNLSIFVPKHFGRNPDISMNNITGCRRKLDEKDMDFFGL